MLGYLAIRTIKTSQKEPLNFEGLKSPSEQFDAWLKSLSSFNYFFDHNQIFSNIVLSFLALMGIIFIFWILSKLNKQALPDLYQRSFIRLTNSSEQDYDLHKNNRNPGLWGTISCIVIGAIGSLLASGIQAFFSN